MTDRMRYWAQILADESCRITSEHTVRLIAARSYFGLAFLRQDAVSAMAWWLVSMTPAVSVRQLSVRDGHLLCDGVLLYAADGLPFAPVARNAPQYAALLERVPFRPSDLVGAESKYDVLRRREARRADPVRACIEAATTN